LSKFHKLPLLLLCRVSHHNFVVSLLKVLAHDLKRTAIAQKRGLILDVSRI